MLFQTINLRVHYASVEALKGVSVTLDEGMITALIGANGAGKSTILKAISGLVPSSSGEIWFQKQRIDRMPPHKIARLGIAHVPEGKRLFPEMTVAENLELGAYPVKDKKQVAKSLESVLQPFPILKEKFNDPAGSLSGGQQQMLATARALMSNPKLLLMDEPSLGLSPIMVQEVGNIIRDINGRGMSIILVEQNARMALRLAHKAYILEVGNVILEGDAKKLSDNEGIKKAYLGC